MDQMIENVLNKITNADALKALVALPTNSIDLVCTDPPYNLGKDYGHTLDSKSWDDYQQFTKSWLNECNRLLKPTGSFYSFMGVRFIAKMFILLEELGFQFNGWITWHYTQGMGRKIGFSPRHEDILYFTKSGDYTFNLDEIRIPQKYYRERNNMSGANPGDVWQFSHVHYSNPEREEHPTQKPEALLARIIAASSNEGDIILDPFSGSGTTARVAQVLKRQFIAFEINPLYVAMAQSRLARTFDMFDSLDPRTERQSKNLPESRKNIVCSSDQMTIFGPDNTQT